MPVSFRFIVRCNDLSRNHMVTCSFRHTKFIKNPIMFVYIYFFLRENCYVICVREYWISRSAIAHTLREETTSYDNATPRGLLGFWNRYHYIILYYTIDIYIIYTHRDSKIYYINNLKLILYNI